MLDHMREADEECEQLKGMIEKAKGQDPAAVIVLHAQLAKVRAYALECATAAANYVHPKARERNGMAG
jgi:hypothetical protein